MSRCRTFLLVSALLASILMADTARNYSLGYSAISLASEVHAQSANPAFLAGSDYHSFYGGYSSLFLGVDDNIYQTYLLYSSPEVLGFGFGAGFTQLASDNYSDTDINLGIGRGFRLSNSLKLNAGLKPHFYLVQYTGYDPTDPFFSRYGDSKSTFGLDVGLGMTYRNFNLGITTNNVVEPNIALSDTVQAGKLGRNAGAGLAYTYRWLTPAVGVFWDEKDPEKMIRYSAGLSVKLIDGIINVNACYLDNQFNIGIGINPRLGTRTEMSFDYTLSNPTGELGNAELRHHHVGIGGRIEKRIPPVVYPELGIRLQKTMPDFVPLSSSIEIPFEAFRNNVPIDSTVQWSLEISGPVSLADSGSIDLSQKQKQERRIKFTPTKRGEYTFRISVLPPQEFPGDSLPKTVEFSFMSTEDLVADITPSKLQLEIEKLTFLSEEEPFVPMVFFPKNSSEIPERFAGTLDIFARRLKRNPDVVLTIDGFIDEQTDSTQELAASRAQVVRDALIKRGVKESSLLVSQDHDILRERVERKSTVLSKTDREMVSEENRRVEFRPMIKGERELVGEWSLSAHIDGISGFIQQHGSILCNNPEVTTQFEWITHGDESGYKDIAALRDLVRTLVETECGREIDIPIIIKEGEKPGISLSLSAEKLIYSPVQYAHSAKDFTIPDLNNPISIRISDPGAVKWHDLTIINAMNGDTIRHLSEGSTAPKNSVLWDWKDDSGILLDPLGKYVVDLRLRDALDAEFHFTSDTLSVRATEEIRRLSESIIIQFAFDDVTSTSRYLESRIDYFAQWIMGVGEDDRIDGATIKVMGHTDPIGTETRNTELSQMRAEKEYLSLRKHMAMVLGLPNLELLDEWLGERNIRIEKEGFADQRPYEIEKMTSDGIFNTFLIGDNSYPEGRSINRRVIILIDERSEQHQ